MLVIKSLTSRPARSDATIACVLPGSKHQSDDSVGKVEEVGLYRRASLRAALRAGINVIKDAGKAASEALDQPKISDAGSTESREVLKIKAKAERKSGITTTSSQGKHALPRTKWGKAERVKFIDSLNDAELRQEVLTRTRGGRRDTLPIKTYERMLQVLPPPLPFGMHANKLNLGKEALKMARKVSYIRHKLKARIEKLRGPPSLTSYLPAHPTRARSSYSPVIADSTTTPSRDQASTSGAPLLFPSDIAHERNPKGAKTPLLNNDHVRRPVTPTSTPDSAPYMDPPRTPIVAEDKPYTELFNALFGKSFHLTPRRCCRQRGPIRPQRRTSPASP